MQADGRSRPYYITTAIPYVNAPPHLGFAQEMVLTDTLARYQRQQGRSVRFQTGSDENALKNVRAADAEGIPTRVFVEKYARMFQELRGPLALSFDDFIRTAHDPRHRRGAERLWKACDHSGDIYRRAYAGLYCVGCEEFYAEEELLADGRCPEHESRPEWVEEENYFFRLSGYESALARIIESGELRILPEGRRREVLALIEGGLRDFSISRTQRRARGWGVPVPGDPDQVMYVWFDALGNYISALGYSGDEPLYREFWAGDGERVHVIGKGITRFHAVYWPALLLSAGVALPSSILIHGYMTVAGQKISKSKGNAIDPCYLAREFGTDALRYYLLRCVRSTEDGDFSRARMIEIYNTDLAGQLGNLLNRTLRMIQQYAEGRVPPPGLDAPHEQSLELRRCAKRLAQRVAERIDRFALHEALMEIWKLVSQANRYVERSTPWALDRQRRESSDLAERESARARLDTVLYELAEALRLIALHCGPFLPTAAHRIEAQLGIDGEELPGAGRWGGFPAGTPVAPGEVLFPKL